MKKIMSWARSKAAKVSMALSGAMLALAGVASAAEGDPATGSAAVISSFQSGFTTMASDAMSMIAIIVPIALGVAGVIWLARKALGWFKSMAK